MRKGRTHGGGTGESKDGSGKPSDKRHQDYREPMLYIGETSIPG